MENAFTSLERAEVLTAALPYIKKYNGKVVVIKYGGNAMINEQLKQQVMEDIVGRAAGHGPGNHGYRSDGAGRQDQ